MNRLLLAIALPILILAAPRLVFGVPEARADGPAAAVRLVALGFENVTVDQDDGEFTVRYENRILRYELHALGEVARVALDEAGARRLTVVTLNQGVAVFSISADAAAWRAFLAEGGDAPSFAEAASIRSEGIPPRPAGASPPMNPRWSRVDLAVRPLFAFELGIADDPFASSFYLAPEAVTAPAKGVLLTLQGAIRVYDDRDPFARRLAPGRSTLSWGGWLPGGWLVAASGGYFPSHRYGVAAEASRLLAGGLLEIQTGADLSGFLRFTQDVTLYSDPKAWSAFVSGTVRPRGIDLYATAAAAHFLEGDLGGRLDVGRRFGETDLAFFAVETEKDTVVGFRIEVPLPLRRLPPPRTLRLATVPSFPFEYRDNALQVGLTVSQYDDTRRLRKGLYPSFVLNNLEDVRDGAAAAAAEETP